MSLPAVDSLQRGVLSLRANWELILAYWGQALLVGLLTLAGLVPPVLVLGLEGLDLTELTPETWTLRLAEWVEGMVAAAGQRPGALVASLAAMLALWLLAFVVYSYFEGGLYGTLAAADRQSAPGATRDWRWFRTFSWRDFHGWGRRYLWRYFWLYNLFAALATAALLLPVGLALLAVWGADRWGYAAAFGIGCGGALPVIFVFFVLMFWFILAAAEAAREGTGVWQASKRSLAILGRRLGAVLLLALVLMAASFISMAFFGPISIGVDLALSGSEAVRLTVQGLITLLQWIWSSLVTLAFTGATVSLVRAEATREPAP